MKENFFTPEISLASGVLSHGQQLDHISKEPGTDRMQFVFVNTPELLHLVQLFWQKQLFVNVSTYHENLKFLKARLRNGTTEARD